MKKSLVIVLGAAIIITAMVFGFLFYQNQKPLKTEVAKDDFDKSGLISLEDWQKTKVGAGSPAIDGPVSLVAVGDIMLSRVVGQKMVKYKNYNYPFEKLKELTSSADLTFGNLESPILPGGSVPTGSFSFRADEAVVPSLAAAGFDVVNLANNHILNQGAKGLTNTFRLLGQNKIDYCGAGENGVKINENVLIKKVKNLRIGFLCYGYGPMEYGATPTTSGIAIADVKKMSADVRDLRENVDIIIVSLHDGTEYSHASNGNQQKFAHAAIEAGADLVIGHHPHVVQEVEQYRGKYIFYSLGNFVFDQMWSLDTRQGLIVKLSLDKSGVKAVNYIPIMIDDYSQPRLANEKEKTVILKYLNVK